MSKGTRKDHTFDNSEYPSNEGNGLDIYEKYRTVYLQERYDDNDYTATDFYDLLSRIESFLIIFKKSFSNVFYSGISTIDDYIRNSYNVTRYFDLEYNRVIALFDSQHRTTINKPTKEAHRIIGTVSNDIRCYLDIIYNDKFELKKSTQRSDSITKGHKETPRYHIPQHKLFSTLLFFKWYDGRIFKTEHFERIPRRSIPLTKEMYISCNQDLLNMKMDITNLYAILDLNRHMHFLNLLIFNYYMDKLQSEEFCNRVFESAKMSSYEECHNLSSYFTSKILADEELMKNVFLPSGVLLLEVFYTHLLGRTKYKCGKTLEEIFEEAKLHSLNIINNQQPIWFQDNINLPDLLPETETESINVKDKLQSLFKEIMANKYYRTIQSYIFDANEKGFSNLFVHLEQENIDGFLQSLCPHFFNRS